MGGRVIFRALEDPGLASPMKCEDSNFNIYGPLLRQHSETNTLNLCRVVEPFVTSSTTKDV